MRAAKARQQSGYEDLLNGGASGGSSTSSSSKAGASAVEARRQQARAEFEVGMWGCVGWWCAHAGGKRPLLEC